MKEEQPNLEYVDQLSGDDVAFKQKFLVILKEEFPLEQQEYQESLELKDGDRAALIVHKLKHKFNILGLHQGYRLAVEYEEALYKGDFGMNPAFVDVLNRIDVYLKTI
ncbi:MAG: Hpt domain-containing protein [Eudoraea sp.]|nr:Hpt domain-containing protein [Eudoraea sp.]